MRHPAQTTHGAPSAHRTSRTAVTAGAALLAVAALSSTGAAAASAHDSGDHQGAHHRSDQRLAPRTHFTMKDDGSSGATQGGEGIPNIDSVKKTIYSYYGDPSGTGAASTASRHTSPR